MDLIKLVDENLKIRHFDFGIFLDQASLEQLTEAMQFCFINSESIEVIVLKNFKYITKLKKANWAKIVESARAEGEHHLRSFASFLLIYCRVDQKFLRDIGVPEGMIVDMIARIENPDFEYQHPIGEPQSVALQDRLNNLKRDVLCQLGFSMLDEWDLYDMFTEEENKLTTRNPVYESC